jgi:hypothetical protein
MTTDFEDPALDELLNRHAATWRNGFAVPALDRMLDQATIAPARHNRRWVWPIAAAALLLAIPVATVVVAHDRPHVAAGHRAQQVPLGVVSWKDAVLEPDGRSISLHWNISTGEYCSFGKPVVRGTVTRQTATTVYLELQAVRGSAGKPQRDISGCDSTPSGGDRSFESTVQLPQPLGDRRLVDASDGTIHPVYDARSMPSVTALPAGFVAVGVSWNEATGTVIRIYNSASSVLEVRRSKPGSNDPNSIPWSDTGSVLGHPAKYWLSGSGQTLMRLIAWRDASFEWSVQEIPFSLNGAGRLSEAQLFAIANSLR